MLHHEFERLPLIVRGESKEVRRLGDGRVAIRFLPTVYSFTSNRCGEIRGTAELRVRASAALVKVLRRAGIDHAYESFDGDMVIAREVQAPPIEVVVKARHVGTPKHRYVGMAHTRTGYLIEPDGRYERPWVRFDWRNPMLHPVTGERLADEVMADDLASEFIDVRCARLTALAAWSALSAALTIVGIELVDICLFIDTGGGLVFGELSPDCARLRYADRELDKDVWRNGSSPDLVLERWAEFVRRIEALP